MLILQGQSSVSLLNSLVFVVSVSRQLTMVDMIIYGALKASNCRAVRWSRVLRPLLLVNVTEGRQVTTRLSHLSEPAVVLSWKLTT